MSFITQWHNAAGFLGISAQAEFDTEAEAQACADAKVSEGYAFSVVFEVGA
jgi:hypothetical protein